jgi:hypothetical protein
MRSFFFLNKEYTRHNWAEMRAAQHEPQLHPFQLMAVKLPQLAQLLHPFQLMVLGLSQLAQLLHPFQLMAVGQPQLAQHLLQLHPFQPAVKRPQLAQHPFHPLHAKIQILKLLQLF